MSEFGWIFVTLAICSPSLIETQARAQDNLEDNVNQDVSASAVKQAESYAAEAFEAYSRQDYGGAIALYIQALEAAPSADILYNLARIYDVKLKDRKRAIEYYGRYASDTGAEPDRLRSANARVRELRTLEAVANEPLPVSVHSRQAPAPAHSVAVRPPPMAAARERGLSALQVTGIITGIAGLGGVGTGIGFGSSAKSDADVAHSFCIGNACSDQRGVDASREASRYAMISTIAFIAGGALAVLGITLILVGAPAEPSREAPRASIAPFAARGSLGAVVAGRW